MSYILMLFTELVGAFQIPSNTMNVPRRRLVPPGDFAVRTKNIPLREYLANEALLVAPTGFDWILSDSDLNPRG